MDVLTHDLRYAIRKLAATPAFTAAAVATLAIGIGATVAIFSTVNAALLRPLPFPRSDDLMSVHTVSTDGRMVSGLDAHVELDRLNGRNGSILRAAGSLAQPFDATLLPPDGQPIHTVLYGVTEGFFDLFGAPMTLGRAPTREEHTPTTRTVPFTLVLSHRVWTTMFGSDPTIVGKTLRFAEGPAEVVGIAGRDFDLPRGTDFWFALQIDRNNVAHIFDGFLRARPGTTPERLRSELAAVMAELSREFPNTVGSRQYVVEPLTRAIVGDLATTLLIVLAATALLLLLACVNVTNLLLARGAAHVREMAVRSALGASRGRIVQQILTESFVIAAAGALAAVILAYGGVRLLMLLGASRLPRLQAVPFDARVAVFAVVTLVVTAAAIGVVPAFRLGRTDLKTLLNESGRSATAGRTTFRLMGAMIVAEVALAIALVAGAGWLIQSYVRLQTVHPGFVTTGRLVIDVRPNFRNFREPRQNVEWTRNMLDRIRGVRGVLHAGSSTTFPLRGDRDSLLFVQIKGEPTDPGKSDTARFRRVTPGFFPAMGVRIVAGRDLTADDRQDTAPVAIVNRAFVRRYLAGKDPLQAQFAFGYPAVDPKTMRAIVGVVEDVKYKSLSEDAEPAYYIPHAQSPYPQHAVVVDTDAADSQPVVAAIREELRRLDPQLAVDVVTASSIVAATLVRQQLGMTLMLLFGFTALTLAAVGIYGVVSYMAAQRIGEVATRLALGATPTQVFWLTMGRGVRLAAIGAAIGLAAAYATGRAVTTVVYGVSASSPAVLLTAIGVVVLVTWIATAIPARGAARMDLVRALRGE